MGKRPVRPDDILDLSVPSDVRLAPDGRFAVWRERTVDRAKGKALSHLVLARTGDAEPRPFTAKRFVDTTPRLRPDGGAVAFLRTDPYAPKKGPAKQQLCVIPTDGGEAVTLLEEAGTFGPPAWSPDGRRLAVAFRRADPLPEDEQTVRSIRVTRLHYKEDGVGYLPQDRFRLYTVELDSPSLVPLTAAGGPDGGVADWDDVSPAWSPDGTRVAFLSNRRDDRDHDVENQDVFVVPVGGGEPVQCTHLRGAVFEPVWSPDGSWLAAVAAPGPPGRFLTDVTGWLYRIHPGGGAEEVCLTPGFDRNLLNLTLDDVWGLETFMHPPAFSGDGRRVYVPVSDEGTTWLGAVNLDAAGRPAGEIERVAGDGGDVVIAFSVARSAARIALLLTSATEPGRLETCDLTGGDRQPLAWPLAPYVEGVELQVPEELRVDSPAGSQVHGWLLLPPGDGPFPLLLDIHGGPVVQFGRGFFHELQMFAAEGYAVLYVNPRGSQGYGADFAAAIDRDWGEPAYVDLMAALDHVVATRPIDPSRLGVLGGSYGGYMTNWVIGHTDRFAAACTQRTVSQLDGLIWDDFGPTMGDMFGAQPWEDAELYRRLSPITYAADMNTPLLILQGLGDLRTPADQGERLFVTLRCLGKEVEMVLFPGGNHDLSRNGPPHQRVERLQVIREWFARHLRPESGRESG